MGGRANLQGPKITFCQVLQIVNLYGISQGNLVKYSADTDNILYKLKLELSNFWKNSLRPVTICKYVLPYIATCF